MTKQETFRRYLIFLAALLFSAFGVALITSSVLGTSPISGLPYVWSVNTPPTMGTYIFILNVLLIFVQMALLGKKGIKQKKYELLIQLPASVVFGAFIDGAMWAVSAIVPTLYIFKLITLVFGCSVLALGICCEVTADVSMLSAEYAVQLIAKKLKKEFGTIKVFFDVTLILLSVTSSLLFAGKIEGIREGTIIAALITGPFVRLELPYLAFVKKFFKVKGQAVEVAEVKANDAVIITISREFGSGGHIIGRMLADKLHIPFYDNKLVSLVADKSGLSEKYIKDEEQNMPSSILYQMVMQDYEAPLTKSLSSKDALFVAQSSVIRNIAKEGSCVIVGRCADFILKDYPNCINIFLHAGMQYKAKIAVDHYGIDPQKAESVVAKTDKARREHYHHYTDKHWGDYRNYALSVDTSSMEADEICTIIEQLYRKKLGVS